MSEHEGCGCCAAKAVDGPRRKIIQIAVAGLVAPGASWLPRPKPRKAPRPATGWSKKTPKARPSRWHRPTCRWASRCWPSPSMPRPMTARDGSRLNKVMLIRLAEADLDAATKARAAGGVLAFSAVCTHQACDVKTWLAKEQVAVCFCHSSKFKLLEGGAVSAGPATKALPTLPLKLEGGQLVVAGGFSAAPGGTTS